MLIAAADRESDIFKIVDVLLDWTHVFVHMWDPEDFFFDGTRGRTRYSGGRDNWSTTRPVKTVKL